MLSPVLVTLIVGRDALLVLGSFAYRAATRRKGTLYTATALGVRMQQ